MSRTFQIALCLGLVAVCGGRARADLVMNGGFEMETGCPSACTPSDWTISGDGVSVDTAFPNTGNYDIAFGTLPGDSGTLSQSITTTAGQNYTLTFFVTNQTGSPYDTFTVSYGGWSNSMAPITGDQFELAPGTYMEETFTVPGTGAATDLVFEGITGDPSATSADWNLDDVSLTPIAAVPAPVIGSGLPAFLAVGGILFGARFLQRSWRRRSPAIARPV